MPVEQILDRYLIPHEGSIIRRYFNEKKALDFINTEELFFSRVDNFNKLDEFIFSIADKEFIREQSKKTGKENWQILADNEINLYESLKSSTFINCWNNDNIELRYMWNNYLSKDSLNGFSIQTTPQKLTKILSDSSKEIRMAKVYYFDPISDLLGDFNTIKFFTRKIRDDRMENEVRLIIQMDHKTNQIPANLRVNVDINKFDSLIFSPNASVEFKTTISLAIHKKWPNLKIENSSLSL
jgi:hypothetical protein